MIGRGAMGNPWIFEQVLELASGRAPRAPSPAERFETIERHIVLMEGCFEDDHAFAHNLKKYVAAYSKGLPESSAFRQEALESDDRVHLLALTRRFFGGLDQAA
jgi:tRNA-dihydrouridine synthase B